jgi:hypothetical protein
LVNFSARDRQARQAHAGGIEDRVADGRRYRRDRMLRGRLGVEGAWPLGSATDQSGFTRRQIARRRDLVIAEAQCSDAAVFDDHLFANGHAQPLQHAALDLALMGQRINDDGDIMEGAESPDLNLTTLFIYLHIGDHRLKDMLARSDPAWPVTWVAPCPLMPSSRMIKQND